MNLDNPEIVTKIDTEDPEPGLYKASFRLPTDPNAPKSLRLVQAVRLLEESPEVKQNRIDPITRQAYNEGDLVIRYLPDEDSNQRALKEKRFPEEVENYETIKLTSLEFINAEHGEEKANISFDPIETVVA